MKAGILASAESVPEYGDFAEPIVTEGRELVSLVATGIHPVVRSIATGTHYGSTHAWPLIPGVDAVARTADGQLIYTGYVEAPYGTFAERMAVPGQLRLVLPAGADPVQVAGGLNPGISSWLPLIARAAEVDRLGTVLVLGVTGMAGQLAVQNSLALGATRVVGAGRNPELLERAAANGASTVALSGDVPADAAAIGAALGDDAPTLVLDFVWGAAAESTFAALGRHGLGEDDADISYIEIGATSGANASVPASLLRSRRIRISGSGAGSASVTQIMREIPAYLQLIADGKVVVPTEVYPLSRVAEAWQNQSSAARAVLIPE
jgi:D-arabinose 1-dehydrogenase-like Zn-dependent alcohol dehydrogenase